MRVSRWLAQLFLVVACLVLIGCGEKELIDNLDGRQSEEILVLLNRVGISADRVRDTTNRNSRFKIVVRDSDYYRALNFLHDSGLPREEKRDLENMSRNQSWTPSTPEEAAIRADVLLGMSIERLISEFPDVAEVRVHVNAQIGRIGSSASRNEEPKVSLVIRFAPSATDEKNEKEESERAKEIAKMKDIAVQAVPGLREETT